jgi:hypothetical protein
VKVSGLRIYGSRLRVQGIRHGAWGRGLRFEAKKQAHVSRLEVQFLVFRI